MRRQTYSPPIEPPCGRRCERWVRPYRRAMRRRFPRALDHQRWHAESGFRQHKRRLGSALTARGATAQQCEVVLRVLTHNLMILRLRTRGFQQGKPASERRRTARDEEGPLDIGAMLA